MKRVFVSLPDGVWKIINRDFKGKMGESESEIVRNMVMGYLMQSGYFVNEKGYEDTGAILQRIDVLSKMIQSMLEMLEEKVPVTYAEFQNRMRKKATAGV